MLAQLEQVSPESEGFSSEALARIDTMLRHYTDDDHRVAGVAALVARHGKIVYYTAAGYNDIAAHKLLKKDDIFRIASQTKAVTGVAVMILYNEGKILLDDPISKYIPEFTHPRVLSSFNEKDSSYTTEPAAREITIRDLLTHTSGISYPVIGSKEARAIYAKAGIPVGFEPRHIRLADKMKILGKLPLMHQPGAAFTYGLSIDVLGYLVEVVSGMPFNDFLRKRIFEPLGMKDTYFYLPLEKQSRLAKVYKTNYTGGKKETVEDDAKDSAGINVIYPLIKDGSYFSGGAGLCSTAHDYAAMLQMLENGGSYNGHRLLSPSTVRLMTSNQIGDLGPGGGPDKFGLTMEVVTEKGSAQFPWNPGTYTWGGFWGSTFWADPKAGIVAQIWTQHPGPDCSEMINKFKVMVYSAMEK
ncbi:serine hydrolase domain-containing protein [Compostibacter hankyongensis]|uniref:Serine hydrolase domain-containing protein n=1 Tax=Compostibacter hankyongensis TaxID=1007089 RepID=A0ABP8FM45_9BACT